MIALIPFSGFPVYWKEVAYIAAGLAVSILSYLIRRELHEVLRSLHSDKVKNDTFSENSLEKKSEDKE